MRSTSPQLRRLRRVPGRRIVGAARRGFTLVEAAIATVIIGLGTVAMMALLAAGTNSNLQTGQLTTAVDLANNIHELSTQLPYPTTGTWDMPGGQTIANIFSAGNVSWLDGQTFSPPIDATATAINGMSTWSQGVTVDNVDPTSSGFPALTPNSISNPMSRVTVSIFHNGNQVYQTSWLVAH